MANSQSFICPACGDEDNLLAEFASVCRLTPVGAEQVGDTEWTGDSHCLCESCGFEGKVNQFDPEADQEATVMKTFSLILTWDNWPEGGSYGTVVQAEDEVQAEELARQEMAGHRAGDGTDEGALEDARLIRETFEDEWIVVECQPYDIWAPLKGK